MIVYISVRANLLFIILRFGIVAGDGWLQKIGGKSCMFTMYIQDVHQTSGLIHISLHPNFMYAQICVINRLVRKMIEQIL